MSKQEPANHGTEEAPAKGGRKKLLLVALLVVIAAAGAGWFLLMPTAEAEVEEPHPGAVVPVDAIAVNLAGGGYLKIGVALQLTEEALPEEVDGTKATDLIISQFSQAQRVDVTSAREALKEALEARIVEAYEGAVMDVDYTEYVTQ
jgi:flagellar FliL protein